MGATDRRRMSATSMAVRRQFTAAGFRTVGPNAQHAKSLEGESRGTEVHVMRQPTASSGFRLMKNHPGGPEPVAQHGEAVGERGVLQLHEDLATIHQQGVHTFRVLLAIQ